METGIVIGSVVGLDKIVVDCDMNEHSVDSDWNWVVETEHCMNVEMMASDAQDQTDSTENLDGFAIPDYMFWSMDCGWVWCK